MIMVGYKGWATHENKKDSAARFTDQILHACEINSYPIEPKRTFVELVHPFFDDEHIRKPVACLIGADYR